MVSNSESNPVKTSIIIFGIAFFALIIFVAWKWGSQGILSVVTKVAWFALGLSILGLIIYGVWWLFQTRRLDMVQIHKDRIVEACELNKVPYKQSLYLKAQGDDWATRKVGEVIGACMIKALPARHAIPNAETGALDFELAQKEYSKLIFVSFHPPGILNKIFGKTEVVGGAPDDFGKLSAEIIYLNGLTFSPKLYLILFLSHHWENRAFIDETITGTIYRYTMQENLKELGTMMEDAIDVSPRHKKAQEMQNIQTIPMQGPQSPPPQGR